MLIELDVTRNKINDVVTEYTAINITGLPHKYFRKYSLAEKEKMRNRILENKMC